MDYSVPACSSIARASFSSVAIAAEDATTATGCCFAILDSIGFVFFFCFVLIFIPGHSLILLCAEIAKEMYDKMLESVDVKRSMPPNAWMWSLIENCKNYDDIKLLFDLLKRLRIFVSFLACTLAIMFPFEVTFLVCLFGFGCRGYQIFGFMIIIILTFAKRSPKRAFVQEPFYLVCHKYPSYAWLRESIS